ncbi:MAG TPA: sugar phosphate isomerase/epimerase [Luteitalea sp.]|nr:sugar phosphate isomerase/epimerase [Luteitalea sp.]
MSVTRREFGKLALAGVPATLFGERAFAAAALQDAKPNSLINGVQLGVITYSYRAMPEKGADAVLRYVQESGISAVELMGDAIEAYAGAPAAPARQGGPGGPGGPGGRRPPTPEETAAREKYAADLKAWRLSQSMDKFKALRKMYNDGGVSIYATKLLTTSMSDEELEYVFNLSEALGATHTTLELTNDAAALKRLGDWGLKKKVYVAYHTHLQGTLTAFDEAFAISKGNMANVDFGHYVAAGSGDPVVFLEKFHGRISSFHLKDRKSKENGGANMPWGQGDTPIARILQTVRKNGYKMPASIEMEYEVPQGSTPVAEVRKCVEFARNTLT